MDTISVEYENEVALVKLNQGIPNSINLPLVREVNKTLKSLAHDSNLRSLILGSANEKFFSIGFDIPGLYELTKEDFTHFYTSFNLLCINLYEFPKPTVAAITGHAIAGGCILTLCCDYRFIAEGHKLMGLNEIKLGVPVPYPADCILRDIIGTRNAREIMETGNFFPPDRLLEMGVVDQVLPLKQVIPASIEKAKTLGELPQKAFAIIKRNRVEMVVAQIQAYLRNREHTFVDLWYSNDARSRLRTAMEKF